MAALAALATPAAGQGYTVEVGAVQFDLAEWLVDAVMTADHRLWFAEEAAPNPRVAQGQSVTEIGRRGAGPEEYERAYRVGLYGDTLWVFDIGLGRVTMLDVSGAPRFLEARNLADLPFQMSAYLGEGRYAGLGDHEGTAFQRAAPVLVSGDSVRRVATVRANGRVKAEFPQQILTMVFAHPFADETLEDGNVGRLLLVDRHTPGELRVAVRIASGEEWSRAVSVPVQKVDGAVMEYGLLQLHRKMAGVLSRQDVSFERLRSALTGRGGMYRQEYAPGAQAALLATTGEAWIQTFQFDGDRTKWIIVPEAGPVRELWLPTVANVVGAYGDRFWLATRDAATGGYGLSRHRLQ
jgi:hypothetical protein